MSYQVLLHKSDQNFEAAENYKNVSPEPYDSSSVPCAYYSCFQFMMYIPRSKEGFKKKAINRIKYIFLRKRKFNNEKGGIHEFYKNLIYEMLKRKSSTKTNPK